MNQKLDSLKKTFQETGVTSLTIEDRKIGRSQAYLDALSSRLGVKVCAHDGAVETTRTEQGVKMTRVGRSEFSAKTGKWVDGSGKGVSRTNDLVPPNQESSPGATAPSPSSSSK